MIRFEAPDERDARERTWRVVRAAFDTRERVAWPRRHVRALAAGALVAAVVAGALSSPGRSVIHSLRKAVGVKQAQPELFSLPTPGSLLVSGRGGAWVIHRDGSRRRLGAYRDASWSPHGLYIAATRANELVALDPSKSPPGNVRWTLPRPSPRYPTWTGTRTDTRIAYLAGGRLRVVGGDSRGDRAIARATRVPPVWRPGPRRIVAYSTGRSAVVYDVDRAAVLLRTPPAFENVRKLAWSADGRRLLVLAPHALRVYDLRGRVVDRDDPSDATADADAAFVPGTHRVVAIRVHGLQSDVFDIDGGRLLFQGTGLFSQVTWSSNGRWLLVAWPTANQWVFVRNPAPRRIVGASRISAQFGGFPHVAGWCCNSR